MDSKHYHENWNTRRSSLSFQLVVFPLCDEYGFCVDVLGRQVPCVCVDVLGRQVPCVCVDVLGSPVRCACVDVLRCTAPSACADAFVTVDIALNKLPVIPATIEVPSAHQMMR
ncbi:hypothetical protein DY000_02018103 [Brassica cretica]|uniref:Bifunctional inhibitor/plant lipid transfer protein/seed storage helical domain-containing protein n=1 Tax=Brassica cretica TaxID=69181 RepID=A0ABQ7CXN5_BRACR|nr:hypothetical protein DY000_02018103 [Brassica cretica]